MITLNPTISPLKLNTKDTKVCLRHTKDFLDNPLGDEALDREKNRWVHEGKDAHR